MKFSNYLKGALLYTGGRFCNLDKFVSTVSNLTDDCEVNGQSDFLKAINSAIENIESRVNNRKVGPAEATLLLVADDLRNLTSSFTQFDQLVDPESTLSYYHNLFLEIYAQIGIHLREVPYYVVDQYPKPYSHLGGAALCPDKSDEIKYGIIPGVYFRRDKLVPIQSTLTLAHELIHFAIGRKDYNLLARGLEEGLCEFLGITYCGLKTFGPAPPQNYMIYRRLKYTAHNQRFKLYMDYFRVATLLYFTRGINGLTSLVNQGRAAVKNIEVSLANGEFNQIDFSPSRIEVIDDVSKLALYISLAFPEHEVVSPLSYWIAQRIADMNTIEEVISQLNLDVEAGRDAINHLESRIFALLLDSNKIEYSDVPTLLRSRTFRYEI